MTESVLDALYRKACEGDGQAQFEWALHCSDQGDSHHAIRWMRRAANSGHADGRLQLALWLLTGHNTDPQPQLAAAQLQQLARHGSAFAYGLVASLYAAGQGLPRSWTAAVAWLVQAASAGLARAICQLGLMLPVDHRDRNLLLAAAAAAGDPVAVDFCSQLRCRDGVADEALANPGLWNRVRGDIVLPHLRPLPEAQLIHRDPPIRVCPGLLTPDHCRYLRTAARPFLAPADVNDGYRGRLTDASRSNSVMGFHTLERDVLVQSINHRLAAVAGLPDRQGEALSVLHYRPGQEYRPHYDFFNPLLPRHGDELRRGGQRIVTVLVYLNDDYDAGDTVFNHLDVRCKGNTGDALTFPNVLPDGTPDHRTLHGGSSPEGGDKWLASRWFRDRAALR
ncbi:MAG: 2OG-Fe(II) oxygenase [Xanthomonadales bacterium]|nr:2OG-Fe(II) oxygenase [Xanthomonadales bacterium]